MRTDLRERFQEDIPEPDLPLDVDELYRRGHRLRRNRRLAGVAAVLLLVAAGGLAASQLLDRDVAPFIEADRQPPEPEGTAVMSLSGQEVEGWRVEIHAVGDGWCERAIYGSDQPGQQQPGATDQTCHEIGPAAGLLEIRGLAQGEDHLAWGLARHPVERIVARWGGREQREATVATHDVVPFSIWAITFADVPPQTIVGLDDRGEPVVTETWSQLTGIARTGRPPGLECPASQDSVGGVIDNPNYETGGQPDPVRLIEEFFEYSLEPSDEVLFDDDRGSATVLRGDRVVASANLEQTANGGWLIEAWAACSALDPDRAR